MELSWYFSSRWEWTAPTDWTSAHLQVSLYALNTSHCTQHTAHCKLPTAHCPLCMSHCTMHTAHFTCTLHPAPSNVQMWDCGIPNLKPGVITLKILFLFDQVAGKEYGSTLAGLRVKFKKEIWSNAWWLLYRDLIVCLNDQQSTKMNPGNVWYTQRKNNFHCWF